MSATRIATLAALVAATLHFPAKAQFPPDDPEIQNAYCFGVMTVVVARYALWTPKMWAQLRAVSPFDPEKELPKNAKKRLARYAAAMGRGPGREGPINQGMNDVTLCDLKRHTDPDARECSTTAWCETN